MKTKYDYVNNTYITAPSEVETTKDIIKSIEKKDQIIEKQNKTIDKLTKMFKRERDGYKRNYWKLLNN